MSQLSFLSIALNNKKLRCEKFLDEMLTAIPWQRLTDKIKPCYLSGDTNKGGRPTAFS